MNRHRSFRNVCVGILALACGGAVAAPAPRAQGADADVSAFVQRHFGGLARVETLRAAEGAAAAVRTVKLAGNTVGWVFRTDEVPPVVRGRNGEIATLVALGVDATVKGIEVVHHREDRPWFERLTKPFFAQFTRLRVDGTGATPDAVTGATQSSRAIIDDVLGACAFVLQQPDVAAVVAGRPAVAPAPPAGAVAEPAGAVPAPTPAR